MKQNYLEGLIRPKSIAIIGASSHPGKIGYSVVQNLIQGGYQGKLYPINPTANEILGIKAYPTISSVPVDIDAAIITIPAKQVLEVTEECGKKGVKGLMIISSGFSEIGQKDLEYDLVKTAKQYGTRILGPNIVGVLSNTNKMCASFAGTLPLPGKAALISQSGALLVAIDASTFIRGIGFNELVSIGNMSDVNFADLIGWFDEDEMTNCIALYMESINNGQNFIETCRKSKKPIIVLKAGSSERGAAAAASHTGSLVGVSKIYSAAFEQAGVIQASDVNNLFDRTLALTLQPPMPGDHLAILTNGGGVGVLAADAAERFGIPVPVIPKEIQDNLKNYMPEYGSAKNPVDLTGMADYERFYQTSRLTFSHSWVDGLIVLICETQLLDPMEIVQGIYRAIEETGIKDKPVAISVVGGDRAQNATRWLVNHGIPAYNSPDLAVNAIAALRDYARFHEMPYEISESYDEIDSKTARSVIEFARDQGRVALTEIESKQIFTAYQLPVTRTCLAKTEEEAIALAHEVGFPVVMKIVSPDILHKSDAGGVKVNIKNDKAAREAYRTILKNACEYKSEADIQGVAVQEMAPSGTEVIIGSVNDPTFGPTIMFGLGGIFVEALKDVTFRVAPVSVRQAEKMLDEIRSAPILRGTRGEAPRDRKALAGIIYRYSHMIYDLGDEIFETDANPCLVYEEGKEIRIVDARIILKKE